jgi:hypothetical protein
MASIIVIGVVFVLDVLAFILAIGAERRRSSVISIDLILLLASCAVDTDQT